MNTIQHTAITLTFPVLHCFVSIVLAHSCDDDDDDDTSLCHRMMTTITSDRWDCSLQDVHNAVVLEQPPSKGNVQPLASASSRLNDCDAQYAMACTTTCTPTFACKGQMQPAELQLATEGATSIEQEQRNTVPRANVDGMVAKESQSQGWPARHSSIQVCAADLKTSSWQLRVREACCYHAVCSGHE
jgi:hypothetical protein